MPSDLRENQEWIGALERLTANSLSEAARRNLVASLRAPPVRGPAPVILLVGPSREKIDVGKSICSAANMNFAYANCVD